MKPTQCKTKEELICAPLLPRRISYSTFCWRGEGGKSRQEEEGKEKKGFIAAEER